MVCITGTYLGDKMDKNKKIKYAHYDEDGNILYQEEAMKIVWLLNPYLYPNDRKKVSFKMEKEDGSSEDFSPTIKGLIGFISAALHHLEHNEEKVKFDN